MIKIFRKIHQKLLADKRFSQYLIYAIGEILLLVIGILIALQINNWNQNKQSHQLESKYLRGVKSNLIDDIDELERLFRSDTAKFDALTFLVRTFNSADYASKEEATISSIYTMISLNWFEGQNVVFEDLKSSGRLNLIESDSIRYAIQKYYRYFEEVIKQEELHNAQIVKHSDKIIQHLNLSSFLEPTFEDRWNGNTGPPNISFQGDLNFSQAKPSILDNISVMKTYKTYNHNTRVQLYHQAISLKKLIEEYLSS